MFTTGGRHETEILIVREFPTISRPKQCFNKFLTISRPWKFNIKFPDFSRIPDRVATLFVVYDFEAILSRLELEPPAPQLKWLRCHDPISVSVASNVTGYSEPQSFADPDPKKLIGDMMHYMGEIADHIYDEAKKKWKYVFDKLEERVEAMVGYGLGADDDDKTDEEEEGDDGETISQDPLTEEEITERMASHL